MNQQQELTQEILNRLDLLAAKLGTTVEYLWPALVREQAAIGLSMMLMPLLPLSIAIACKLSYKGLLERSLQHYQQWREKRVDYHYFYADRPDGGPALAALITGWCCVGVTVIMVIVALADGLPRIIAPEAAALRGILP